MTATDKRLDDVAKYRSFWRYDLHRVLECRVEKRGRATWVKRAEQKNKKQEKTPKTTRLYRGGASSHAYVAIEIATTVWISTAITDNGIHS